MAFRDMAKNLQGDIPGYSAPQAEDAINEALTMIYDESRWSFQVKEGGWLTPGLLGGLNASAPYQSPGTISVDPYQSTVYADAVATTFWASLVGRPFITEQQFRIPAYSLYNIINYYAPGTNPADLTTPFATLVLDRPWMEPKQVHHDYMIYQAYFPTGVDHFRKWGNIRDTTNNAWLNAWRFDQAWLSRKDPQRTVFDQPSRAIPYQTDQRPGSATLGQMMYELWPHPLSILPYTYSLLHKGPKLRKPTDTVPYPLTEELVMWRAKEAAYIFKESQKGDGMQRGAGANWQFLAQYAEAQYARRIKDAKLIDMNLGDLYWSKFERTSTASEGYETTIGTLNVGAF